MATNAASPARGAGRSAAAAVTSLTQYQPAVAASTAGPAVAAGAPGPTSPTFAPEPGITTGPAGAAGRSAVAAVTPVAPVSEHPAGAGRATRPAADAGATGSAVAPEPGATPDAAGAAGRPVAAVTPAAEQQPAAATRTTGRTRSTRTAPAAGPDQARSAAGAAGHPRIDTGHSIATIAVQQPAGPAGLPGRGSVSAVADQRSAKQRQRGRVDRIQ